jgi:UDP-3-O-[3-hydroxymyristoyl] N-acetylglucosamine deacetylase
MIRHAGTVELTARRKYLAVTKQIAFDAGPRRIEISPCSCLKVECAIEFDHPAIGCQEWEVTLEQNTFEREIAAARTFVFLEEFEWRQRIGLLRGASPENSIVLMQNAILNPNGLRFADEFVRHKTLDIIGDLATLGLPVLGHVRATRSGHALHNALCSKLAADRGSWQTITA